MSNLIKKNRRGGANLKGALAEARGMAAVAKPWVSEDEDAKAVAYLLRRQKRTGTVEQQLQCYQAEMHTLHRARLRRVEEDSLSSSRSHSSPRPTLVHGLGSGVGAP